MNEVVNQSSKQYVVSVDIGTTNIRCHIYNEAAQVVGQAQDEIPIIYPQHGWVEIDPAELWRLFISVIKDAFRAANIHPSEASCIAISTQRSTFTTWDRETRENYHNFIVWSDNRTDTLCKEWNKSVQMKLIRLGSHLLYLFTRKSRFLAASVLKFSTPMANLKLLWVMQAYPQIRQRALENAAMFGTIDTWLLWKLTNGTVHATEPSNACVTGLYDPFQMDWASWATTLLNIPCSLLPEVKSTSTIFGVTDPSIFGASIPIGALVGDQQASMFGEGCFFEGDVKCTLGTGSFIQVNTGKKPHASVKGIYPVVGWQLGDKITYLAEGKSHDNGTIISWAQRIGLFDDPAVTSAIAYSIKDSGGVYFVPAFAGIQAPVNDNQATAAFVGLTPDTRKEHLIRSILEALSFRILQLFEMMQQDTDFALKTLRIDGGVSENDFVAQLISDLTCRTVVRPEYKEMSSLGAAFLGGLAVGVWKDLEELQNLKREQRTFQPSDSWQTHYKEIMHMWERAVTRCMHWYSTEQ